MAKHASRDEFGGEFDDGPAIDAEPDSAESRTTRPRPPEPSSESPQAGPVSAAPVSSATAADSALADPGEPASAEPDSAAPAESPDSAAPAELTDLAEPVVASQSIVNQGPGARPARPARSAPPPRPEMSLETPAPVVRAIPRTAAISFSRIAWMLSFGLATAATLFAVFASGARQTALEGIITDLAENQDAATMTALTAIVFWTALGSLIFVTVLELIFVTVMLGGRSWPRWALIAVVLVPHLAAAIFANAFVAIDDGGLLVTILIAAQWVVAAIATTAALLPGSSEWFLAKRKARAGASA